MLLHEIAHLRQGDHLVVGLGSPFPWLVRVWAPVFLAVELVPLAVFYVTQPGLLTAALGGQVVTDLGVIPRQVILPVAALWLAELSADRFAADVLGPAPIERSLAGHAGGGRYSPLSHPPRPVRRELAGAARAARAVLLTGWFTALLVQLAVTIVVATPAFLLEGLSLPETAQAITRGIRAFLLGGRPIVLAGLALILAWPYVSRLWLRCWTRAAPAGPPPRPADHLAAAALPGVLLLAPYLLTWARP